MDYIWNVVMVTIKKRQKKIPWKAILNEGGCPLLSNNTFGKGMNLFLLPEGQVKSESRLGFLYA